MMRPRPRLWAVLLSAALLPGAGPGLAQSPEASAPEAEARVAPVPRPRPPPRKPKPKPPQAAPAEAPPAAAVTPPAVSIPPAPAVAPAAPMPAANLPGLTVQCEARAAHYEGPQDFAVWVTRTGLIVVENPLRPLTPETTRVLQVVIAGKAATAYGPDLFALRRGASPGALEAMLGAPTRWDAVPTALPDTLTIVSETGQVLAQLGFRECGEAPAVKAPPAVAKDKPPARKPRVKAAGPDGGEAPAKTPAVRTPPGLNLPQGAIE